MTIVHRRVFYGKVGTADQIVKLLKEFEKMAKPTGFAPKATRIMTDHLSGRTDRVAWAWEIDSLDAVMAAQQKAMGDPKQGPKFEAWFKKLSLLIDHAEVENWTLQ